MTDDTKSLPKLDIVPDELHQTASDSQQNGNETQRQSVPALETFEDTEADSSHDAATPARRNHLTSWLLRTIPTVLVLAALAAIGYWGHHSGWKLPKFSELNGSTSQEDKDWCAEHGVPESICVACNASLMPKKQLHGWCKEHGVAECVFQHPQLAQLKETPILSKGEFDRVQRALAVKERPKNDPACKLHLRRIQFASRAAADKAGIDIGLVDRETIVETVRANGEIVYDPTRVARLSARTTGSVWRVEKYVGDAVKEGELLALVDAAEVGQAKAAVLQMLAQFELATKNYNRLSQLGRGTIEGRKVLEAETALSQARVGVHRAEQTLVNLGLPADVDRLRQLPEHQRAAELQLLGVPEYIARTLDPKTTTANLLPVRATLDGLVVARDVVKGEVVSNTKRLFTIADASRMWLMLNVPVEDAKYVKKGQKIQFRADGTSHDDSGAVTWISTEVDPLTRTVEVRAELLNADSHLRNEMFGVGRIVLREEQDAIVVPSEAVHWEGCCFVAFVRDKDYFKKDSYKVFHTRMVRPGVTKDGQTEIIAGLLPDEVVVTKGSGVLRAELLKGNLGAG
jgi:multidrug efflux pump subunit AcrA (membrane-fusion protein)